MSHTTHHQVALAGTPIEITGQLPTVGSTAPAFTLTAQDLSSKTLADFTGQRKILNIVPSLDTPVCAKSTHAFLTEAATLDNVIILAISADLPFAAKRFCTAEGIHVETLSTFKSPDFSLDYGVAITNGKLAGLTARAVLVLNEHNQVLHAELVADITHEPNYAAALAVLR